jgi:hypothetical protein
MLTVTTTCDAAGVHQEGEVCDQRTIYLPVCARGLVCNAPRELNSLTRGICVRPYSVPEGGACAGSVVCADGLICSADKLGEYKCANTVNQYVLNIQYSMADF